ncbi:MAG: hypothetical protein IPJ65_34480 [Archangiaceae bacterium]|nr:hypothetical protein [Archangiaceae bacterium]
MTFAAAPAWAVGERVSIPKGAPYADQLRETLCISMECGTGTDASVTARVLKGKVDKVELKVFSPSGALKTTVTAPLDDSGRMSSMDLVAATSGLIAGIEGAEPSSKVAAAKAPSKKTLAAAKAKKKSGLKLASKPRNGHSRG